MEQQLQQSKEDLHKIRHSAEHILSEAMQRLFGKDKFFMAMGPATDEGFYMDFEPLNGFKVSEEDFPAIEAEMAKIVKENQPIVRHELTLDEAKEKFKDNPYKVEWLEGITDRGEVISVYETGSEFVDLCAGPHVESTARVPAFKLLSIAGAYWHGDENNKMLTRIYGTAFENQAALDEYLKLLEEEKESDHRTIGKNLNLFVFSDLVGKGLPLFTPKGSVIRRELERFVVDEEIKRGYLHVYTPDLARVKLYETSGHYPYYKDTMYPVMKVDDEELILRPMTCPHHFMLYKSQKHSYRELPLRIAETAHQFRYEKSGELSGLHRVRMFCLADSHIFAQKTQAKQVIKEVLDLIDYANTIFGNVKGNDYFYRLSLGDRSDANKKFYKNDEAWEYAESVLRDVLKESDAPFYEALGEAAFYGPKIDVQMRRVSGKDETAFTVQYDFVMPERFDLKFTNDLGEEERPVVIHRSSIGAFERIIGFLIEKYKGAFPVWLSPLQAVIIPITDKQLDYANSLAKQLRDHNIRVQVDDKAETMQNKIRTAQMEKVPYMLIVGGREVEAGTVSVRQRDGQDLGAMPFDKFLSSILDQNSTKSLNLIK